LLYTKEKEKTIQKLLFENFICVVSLRGSLDYLTCFSIYRFFLISRPYATEILSVYFFFNLSIICTERMSRLRDL